MRIVIALDSFKGSLSAPRACAAVGEGLRAAVPAVECVLKPMADGGEGTAATLLAARPGGHWIPQRVQGPRPPHEVTAGFAWFPADATAVIEMATASGLPLLAEHERNPLLTSTYGTGQLLEAACEQGARHILLTLGGSATVDGGVGAASALGWRFLDARGGAVPAGGGGLNAIARIERPAAERDWPTVTMLCDVTNPLCGPRGAAAVFGPQKGATPAMVAELDAGLANLAARMRADLGRDVLDLPGGGAAGGLGAGAVVFFHAQYAAGITAVMDAIGLKDALAGADWCITGEGSFDSQSLDGKVVSGVAEVAQAAGVPVAVFAGQAHVAPDLCRARGIHDVRALQVPGMPLAESLRRTPELLRQTAADWVRGRSAALPTARCGV
ncbi:MAG: glycerate kinase [Candidatus Marinimicrobia bacterium]|nr:glycerate kinase [Candidatus Neomarinimicrobiota bacterium]